MKPTPSQPWYQNGVLYQIYPLSFADSNQDGFGDIPGIIKHLDYLNDGTVESLGVAAIWLSPIYVSPMADWGYDVADYTAIDPRFGTMRDFERLVEEVHRRGMKLLLDYVPNHTSDTHPWFLESRSGRHNPKRDWYIWADPGRNGGVPNNWVSDFGGSAWTLDELTGQYYMHSFLPEQPDLNWRNPKVRQALLGVLHFWLDKGVDGFRVDAVYNLMKDGELRDDIPNPAYKPGVSPPGEALIRVHSGGLNQLNPVLTSFCDELNAMGEGSFLLSEAYLNIPGLHQLYRACQRHPIHAPFNFNLMTLDWSARAFRKFIDEYEASLGAEDWPNYVLGNHDRRRLVTRVGVDRARLLALLQLTLRGLPVIYYGEELGLADAVVTKTQVRDTWEVRMPGRGFGRDGARSPMPWSGEIGASFTTSKPWLPLEVDYARRNVEHEEHDPDSSLHLYRHLIHLRATSPALSTGDYHSLSVQHDQVYAYIRETELQRYVVVLNFGEEEAEIPLSGAVGAWVAGTHMVQGDGEVPIDGMVKLKGYEGRMYEFRQGADNGSSV